MGFEPGSTTIKRTSLLTYPLDHGSLLLHWCSQTMECSTYCGKRCLDFKHCKETDWQFLQVTACVKENKFKMSILGIQATFSFTEFFYSFTVALNYSSSNSWCFGTYPKVLSRVLSKFFTKKELPNLYQTWYQNFTKIQLFKIIWLC